MNNQTKAPAPCWAIDSVLHVIRGFLIGLAELVPGISGGTIALVVGVYERLIDSGMSLLRGVKNIFRDRASSKRKFAEVEWVLIFGLLFGMLIAIFSMAGTMASFVDNHAPVARALFLGMVATSIYVPFSMVDRVEVKARPWVWLLFAVGAVLTFFGTGITSATRENPSLLVVFGAAAIAVCALVLPGVSGSFFLLAVGLYQPVMAAVAERDVPFMAVFAAGALTGIVLFIRALDYLLENHRTVTLVTMAGLMLGSLRALWPWQDGDANLLAPASDWPAMLGWFVLGSAMVIATLSVEHQLNKGEPDQADKLTEQVD
ncbi:putative membrane protein [Trueperella bonasi]|uniref:Membrane protein n=1 Tax=Trueperella bonasi TaxID=312286 RepID=A0ABT9NHC6_9ACTO|nr:DUF368 domain-containing protein [Trueperella bonasi]MDP9806809.1 putative membrane protein [Trueperella bonasi]